MPRRLVVGLSVLIQMASFRLISRHIPDMPSLFDRCKRFWKTAKELKVSLVENNDPFLKQLSDTKDYKKRVELAEESFKKLGEGSSRTIFKMDDNNILKVAHNEKGEAQNLAES